MNDHQFSILDKLKSNNKRIQQRAIDKAPAIIELAAKVEKLYK